MAINKTLKYLLWLLCLLIVPSGLFGMEPAFQSSLRYPAGYIAPYPKRSETFIVSMAYRKPPAFKRSYKSKPKVTGSSFESNSLTITGAYYRKGKYIYSYTPRSVDANAFLEYRRRLTIKNKLGEFSTRALAKKQKDKRGGLLQVNIPLRSKAVESIFGEGGAGLKVSGHHQIIFSGRSQWDDRTVTATYKQSKFPTLNMEQISRFDIRGTIGSKVTVSVSQDSKTQVPLANRIIIRYKGDEDDIIKSIEAGNTTLSLPKTQLVGYSSRIRGLFGVKATAQIGGLSLTAIASQEKGSTERTSIKAGASASKITIRDWQIYAGKIFDLGRKSDFEPGDSIKTIIFYKFKPSSQQVDPTGNRAIMYVDPTDTSLYANEASEVVDVEVVDSEEYDTQIDKNTNIPRVTFRSLYGGAVGGYIGIYMEIIRGDSTIIFGDTQSDPMKLMQIKNKSPEKSQVTWGYEWRNVYYLKSTDIDYTGLEINIFKGPPNTEISGENLDHQDGVRLVQIMGLDQYTPGKGQEHAPDGIVDFSVVVEPDLGLLIFPNRRPFDSDKSFGLLAALKDSVPEIYDKTPSHPDAQQASTYYIEVSNRSRSAQINLGRSNIIENSERITLNGRQLVKGTDYNISYDFGSVTFLTDDALDPNASLAIDYEYSPMFALQKKTLFGIRGEYEVNKNLEFGGTFLYKSDKATERKPRIGQETTKMIIWDANTRFSLKPEFVTKLANALPFYSTETPSSFAVRAEIAQSFPDPNVDGVAYIDDFEGSRDSYSLGVIRETWHYSSRPVGLDDTRMRGWLNWYNPYDQTSADAIWNREFTTANSRVHTLWLESKPGRLDRRIGEYLLPTDSITDALSSWSGIMRSMSTGVQNQDRAQLLEMRISGDIGILHIDLGKISQDLNSNAQEDYEGFKNDLYANDTLIDDIGLDHLTDPQEWPLIDTLSDSADRDDPFGDNFYYDPDKDRNDYKGINGTQHNISDPGILGRNDRENMGGIMWHEKNNYFSFRIDLADPNSPFLVEGSQKGEWRSFRIPIKDTAAIDTIVGVASWDNIESVRLWVDSVGVTESKIKIASIDLVSSNWDDILIQPDSDKEKDDSLPRFTVGVINTQEHDSIYDPPPDVVGYYDKVNKITEPEQSLLLHFANFEKYESIKNPIFAADTVIADTGIAERILFDTPNLMGYRSLKMYVHGPACAENGSLLFFFRIGTDPNNYYEHRKILDSGWAGNEVNMNFNEITGLKEYLVRARKENADINVIDSVINGNNYRVVGNPNITRVKYLAAGVVNLGSSVVTGDVWIDELRLDDVRRDVGLAVLGSVSGNFADLFNYSFSYSYKNSFFRQISTSTRGGSANNLGSGQTETRYSFGISGFKVDRFLPRSWGASLPITVSYSKTTNIPRLRARSDIILPEELRESESTVSVSRSLSISESFNKKTKNPLFTLLLNKMRTSFSYNRSNSRSPLTPVSISESYQLNGSYGFTIKSVPSVKLFFWTQPIPLLKKLGGSKFFLMPGNLSLKGNFGRRLTVSRNSDNILSNTLTRNFNGSMKLGYKIFESLVTNYSMTTKRDLSDPRTVVFSFNPKKFKFGRETSYSQTFGASYSPVLFRFLTHKFNFSATYRENIIALTSVHNATAGKSYGISGSLTLSKLLGSGKKSKDRQSKYKRRQEKKEKEKEDKESEDKPKKSIFGRVWNPIGSGFRFLTGWIDPITYDYKEGYNYSYPGLAERAQLKFRFGLTDDAGVPISSNSGNSFKSNSASKSISYSLRSGTSFFGGIKTGVTFSRSIRMDLIKAGNRQKTVATTFPDISFTIRPLKTFTFLNTIIKKFSPRTKFSRSMTESYNLTTGHKNSEKTTISQSPLLSFNVGVMKGLQINVKTDRSVSTDNRYDPARGALTSTTRATQKSTTFGTKYSFTWPTGIKIPLLGRIKFRSTMSVSLDVAMRSTKTEKSTGDGPLNSQGERSDFLVTTSIAYSFSSQIKGGMSGRWQDTDDKKLRRKSHIREIRIWVDIRF